MSMGTLFTVLIELVIDPADVDSELRALCDALLASGAESSREDPPPGDSWSI
jgi:hypothetical protein